MMGRICGNCCRPINDRYILQVMDVAYHEHCLHCYACGDRLYQTCFVKESKLFCRIDYDRLYVKKCLGCSERIGPEELVMRTCESVFHVRCFACVVCGMRLQKGDHYVFKQGQVFCKPDYEKEVEMLQAGGGIFGSGGMPPGAGGGDFFCDDVVQAAAAAAAGRSPTVDGRRGPKRPRTILTTQQRRAFKASFEISPKPCRKVRETLAKDTGLSIRIVQVWFQNQRAKMKKMKKKAGGGAGGGDKGGGGGNSSHMHSSSDLDGDEKPNVKEEEQSPRSMPFMSNDSCSDSETMASSATTTIPGGFGVLKSELVGAGAGGMFLNIKEEPDLAVGNDHYFKTEERNSVQSGLDGGKFHHQQPFHHHLHHHHHSSASSSSYLGFPFSGLESAVVQHHQLSAAVLMAAAASSSSSTPPPAHKSVVTHGVHMDVNPIDRLYSMQNSYFCTEEPSGSAGGTGVLEQHQ